MPGRWGRGARLYAYNPSTGRLRKKGPEFEASLGREGRTEGVEGRKRGREGGRRKRKKGREGGTKN
jgi:hypothetical protein